MLLGAGDDNGDYGTSEFFKGAVMARYPSDATEDAVRVSIVVAGHQQIGVSSRSSGGSGGRPPRRCLDHGIRYARGAAPTGPPDLTGPPPAERTVPGISGTTTAGPALVPVTGARIVLS